MAPEQIRLLARLYELGHQAERLGEMATSGDLDRVVEGPLRRFADQLNTATLLLSGEETTDLRGGARDLLAMASSRTPPNWNALERAAAQALKTLQTVSGRALGGNLADLIPGLLLVCNADIVRDGRTGRYSLPEYAPWLGRSAADLDDVVRAARYRHLFDIGDQDGSATVMTLTGDGRLEAEELLSTMASNSIETEDNRGPSSSPRDAVDPSVPRVFISYSHDDVAHEAWVLKLGERLRAGGVDAVLDQWDLGLGQDLAHFMETGIAGSHRVVMVCSPAYVTKANAGAGGVGYEKMIVTREIVANSATDRFIPVIRRNPDKITPTFLGTRRYVDFNDDETFEAKLEELLRAIHGAPKAAKPPLGDNPYWGRGGSTGLHLDQALGATVGRAADVALTLAYTRKPTSTGEIHWYDLVATIRNASTKRIDDWQMEIAFPTPLLDQTVQAMRVAERSDDRRTLFLIDGRKGDTPLYPHQQREVRIGYLITRDIFWNRKELFDESVTVRALADGEIVAEENRPIRDLQNF